MTGLSVATISRIFNGQRQPSLKSTKRIAAALQMGAAEFLKGLEVSAR